MKIVGVIPARKGSKGIPNKNMIDLRGKPLIEYTFIESVKSKLDEVILTTDDENIIRLAKDKYPSITVPYIRPENLSCGETEALDVALHLLEWYKTSHDTLPDAICWLQPTSPLRTRKDIDACIDLMNSNNADSVISIVDVHGMNPYKMRTINNRGSLQELIPLEGKSTNRQKLPKAYIPNGAVFMVKTSVLLEERNFFGQYSIPYEMEEEASVNIDTPLDLELTKVILQKGVRNEV